MNKELIDDIEEKLFDTDFDRAWKIVKVHKKFKGYDKRSVRNNIPGTVSFVLLDLYRTNELTKNELNYLFQKTNTL
jgi:hypothetical protein